MSSKRDRQGARTVADLNRRYNIREAEGAASSALKASEQAKSNSESAMSAVADKVDKKDYDTVVDMLNASNAIVRLLAGRLFLAGRFFLA